jgi:branched-chain amino acid aminotransferase
MDLATADRINTFLDRRDDWFAPLAAPPRDWPEPEQLVFGRHLAPLALLAEHTSAGGWSPPRIAPLSEARLPVASAAAQYGLSVFEGLKAYRDARGAAHLFRPQEHAARFNASARRLGMPTIDEDAFIESCRTAVRIHDAYLPPHGRGSLYLRPTLAATEEALGFRVANTHQFSVTVMPCCDPPLKSMTLWAEPELTRAAPGGLGAAKTGGNYAAGLLGMLRAREQGCDDVAWCDALTHTKLAEAGTMNLFVEIDRVWVTPPLDGTLLAGVTRDSLMHLMRDDGLRVEEREIDLRELARLERAGRVGGAVGTGTAARVVRISQIRGPRDAVAFRDTGHALRFWMQLRRAQEGRDATHPRWCVAV